ncbi:MAG: FAD-dependent oxidoreductase [bacterium]|nr:FAD-dependent oxidoreductase [bacterium]
MRVVVVGGGWAGCAAALSAARAGAEVILLERTDALLGTGLVGGIMRNNGRFTATEEAIAAGGGTLFQVCDEVSRHRNIEFPGHKHASLYDIALIEPAVLRVLREAGVDVRLQARMVDCRVSGGAIGAVVTRHEEFEADVFVECTGTAGPQGNCQKYGNGCVMCVLRCQTFGGRVSLAAKAGVAEMIGGTAAGTLGSMSGSCKLFKESLAPRLVEQLNATGLAIVPIPEAMQKKDALLLKACQQYALPEYAENVILLDTGHAKLMTAYFPLAKLREIPGLENARFEDPYSGGVGNSIRYMALSPRDDALRVEGLDNLFCAGEKAGPLVGHTEAIVTGTLAGHNAARRAMGYRPLILPRKLAIGDAIAHVREQMATPEGLFKKYTFSGSVYFQRMKELDLYTTDREAIRARVQAAGLTGVFSRPLAAAEEVAAGEEK